MQRVANCQSSIDESGDYLADEPTGKYLHCSSRGDNEIFQGFCKDKTHVGNYYSRTLDRGLCSANNLYIKTENRKEVKTERHKLWIFLNYGIFVLKR